MKHFKQLMQVQFDRMCATNKLFRVELSGQSIWELYLASFIQDPIFRDPNSSVHNCNHCNNFIRRYGNIVAIDDNNNIMTIFDIQGIVNWDDKEFLSVTEALTRAITSSHITEVFFETFNELNSLPYEKCNNSNLLFRLGTDKNTKMYSKAEAEKYGIVTEGEIRTFEHMSITLPKSYVDMSGKSIESIMGEYRDAKNVFQRGMETISLDTLKLVKDLINQGSLLDGQTHLYKIDQIIPLKEEYDSIPSNQRNNWCWKNSYKLPISKFRNELIGVLCSELSEGEELNKACQSWNKRVDPANYMKAKAPITSKQIEEAKLFVEENGYSESFSRRLANMDDIKVSEILHSNIGKETIKSVSMFDSVKSTSSRHKRNEFDGVEEVIIDKFMKYILPSCTSIEAFLNNTHEGNMVTLTTANNPDSKPIFKWSNNYSWTFNGNLAGKSQIKEAVKSHGGKVDGILRFSIMWAEDSIDDSDLDAHCIESFGTAKNRIFFGNKVSIITGGNLDIDITQPQSHKKMKGTVVENITFPSIQRMRNGTYTFLVNQYTARQSKGFKAEIEFNGEIYQYEYKMPVSTDVIVGVVTFKDGVFTIEHKLPETTSSKEIYGLNTNEFHKVNLLCLSPNHWGNNNTGNKHYFFMLDKCVIPYPIRSFHNENLISEIQEHRKVMEVLGSTNMIGTKDDKQLSGLGFNSTVRDELVVRLSGTHKRVIRIKF